MAKNKKRPVKEELQPEVLQTPVLEEAKEEVNIVEEVKSEDTILTLEETPILKEEETVDEKVEEVAQVLEALETEEKVLQSQEETLEVKEETKEVVQEEVKKVSTSPAIREEIVIKPAKELEKEKKLKLKEEKQLQKNKAKMVKEHRKSLEKKPEKIIRYDTDKENGLPEDIVEKRILDNLVNKNNDKKSKTIGNIICTKVFTFFNILCLVIAGILITVAILWEPNAVKDLVFLVVISANTIIGIIQEIKAKKTIDQLSIMSAPTAVVKRDGVVREIDITEVVLDDLILLDNGKQICADSIVLEGQVEVNESLLTGESDAIIKRPGDRLYSGSFVVSGNCSARVDAIGKDNYIEQLTSQAKKFKQPKSDLMQSLNWIIRVMAIVIIPLGALLFWIMYFKTGLDIAYSIRKTAGAMIGMIPSGLFLMTSVALAVGVIRLGQKHVLVQELYCIEMLARVNCICLDKTGTITDGTMNVKNVIDYNQAYSLTNKNIISAMLNALHDDNLTSRALKERFGLGKRMRHVAAIPFSSQRKYQAVTFDKYGTFILGAPEFVLKHQFKTVKNDVEKYAKLGFRVLTLCHKEGIIANDELPEGDVTLLSMILIEDNIRPDAINTIKYFRESGVQVKVISGDNPLTVSKISQRAGIENAENYISLDGLTDQEVIKVASKYTVFGRVSPAQKKLLIETLKDQGLTVAMTGDGVNDILALKEADCSIAVASGSEAAANVAHLVLLDSNFDSMPSVVAEGRRVINNVTSVSSLFLTKTIFSLFLAIETLITGSYPISTSQLILIEALAIGIPSIVLVLEPNNNIIEGRFLINVIKKALPGAIVILIISIITFMCKDSLNLDTTSLSTIIVIAATHTCLMVLFKTCKPFNTRRRFLCGGMYSIFLFCIIALPQWLEFRPLFSWTQYYSSNYTTEIVVNYPTIAKSRADYYVVDGKLTTYARNPNEKNTTISCYKLDDKFYYTINGTSTDVEINMPDVTYNNDGNIYFGGYKVSNLEFEDDLESRLYVDSLGYLYLDTKLDDKGNVLEQGIPVKTILHRSNDYYKFEAKYGQIVSKEVQVCIMPQLKITDDEVIINGIQSTDYRYKISVNTSMGEPKVTINPLTRELLINGSTVSKTLANGVVENETYKVEIPAITTDCNGKLYIDAVDTKVTLNDVFGDIYDHSQNKVDSFISIKDGFGDTYLDENGVAIDTNKRIGVYPYAAGYYLSKDDSLLPTSLLSTDVKLSNPSICVDIDVAEANHLVIDGYYTNYIANSRDSQMTVKKNDDSSLVIDGIVTDYKISANDSIISTGGLVQILNAAEKIFLLMLCLISAPLMKILQGMIPWIRKQIKSVQNLLTKF